jgi:hypothetical protein
LATEAKLLDDVVAEIDDVSQAYALMIVHMTPARMVELLAEREELSSAAILTCPFETVVDTLVFYFQKHGAEETHHDALLRWMMKLTEHGDFMDILEQPIGDATVIEHACAAVWAESGSVDMMTADRFEQIGINPEDAFDILSDMFTDGKFPKLLEHVVGLSPRRASTELEQLEQSKDKFTEARRAVDAATDSVLD